MTGVGVCLPQLGPHTSGPVVRDFCVKAEAMGFTSLWVQEHLFYPLEPESGYANIPGRAIPQPYRSTLAATELLMAAAAWTDVVTVGTSVLVGGYHRPIELASRLATIDVLSGGRLVVGLSVGWSNDEHEQMDVTTDRRGARLEELVAALIACWGPDPVTFDGEFFHIPKCEIDPKPLQQPRPSLISGLWGPVGLRRTARAFDGWNPTRGNPSAILPVLEEMAAIRPAGMAPLDVWYRTFLQPPGGPLVADAMFAQVAEAKELGFREVIIDANFYDGIDSPQAWLDVLDLLAPAL